MDLEKDNSYQDLIIKIGETLQQGRVKAVRAVQNIHLITYWNIGKYIIEFEQQGRERAEYGSYLLDRLSKDLTANYDKSFSRSFLVYIRKLYLVFPIGESLIHQLSWTHYIEFLKIEDELERNFYITQALQENWGVRELKRQIKSSLFHRLALSKDKAGILKLSQKGQVIERPEDIIREPVILEFLKIPENKKLLESELEQKLIDNLQTFLMELGKGFAFIGRQYRIPIAGRNFRADLVFYHRILKCFVLIDLKRGEVTHEDIGQMNLYLNYFKKEENVEGDNEPIGIILGASKDDVFVEYALNSIQNSIFVNRYQLYLPNRNQLENELRKLLADSIDKA
jgi:predicted nuclease of restriction endonuclease-like (RecB) superfamily